MSDSPEQILSVSEVTKYIKQIITMDDLLSNIWITGEVSNVREYRAGNQLYFTLKDDSAQISCVIFGSNKPRFALQDNLAVIARGKVSVYEKRGVYTFQVRYLEPAGVGALALAFEQLKQKLEAEGLFKQDYKKGIPLYPKKVGVISSPTGAALHDVIVTIKQRNPSVQIIIIPAVVQGNGVKDSVVKAIQMAEKYGEIDALILARGGGSIEELWGFNEEVVARAIFKCEIPIISAIGHEVDFTISDFVADARAATPTAAGVMVSIPRQEYLQYLLQMKDKFKQLLVNKVQEKSMYLADLNFSLKQNVKQIYNSRLQNYLILKTKLEAMNPLLISKRGYIMVKKAGKIVKSVNDLSYSEKITLQFFDGVKQAEVL